MDDLSSAVIHLDSSACVISANRSAETLLQTPSLNGRLLPDILDEAEKSGTIAAGTALPFFHALSGDQPRHLFDMRDGRKILVTFGRADTGEIVLELADVSHVVRTVLRGARDPITGLPSRLELFGRLEDADAARANPEQALLHIDLDRFKPVTDALGHAIGDTLLKLVAERIAKVIAPDDLLVRMVGSEFAILQRSGSQPKAAEDLAIRLIDLVGRTYLVQGHVIEIDANLGIALSIGEHGSQSLIQNANLARVQARAEGPRAYRFFTPRMDSDLQARRTLETDLRRAMALQEFSLVYQPQIQIEGNRLVGFEALLRWWTPERGHVSPGLFIPLAEEIGIIEPLGEWALRTACADAAAWPEMMSVSVNLSPLQFKSARLVPSIASALADSGLSASRLDLEITEGALMDDTDAVVAMLKQIKALGIKVSMDDFGTGYSSLSYLQKFPFDKIKIDQSFVRNTSPDSAAIIRAVSGLGKSLGMVTIAEGVETESQMRVVASHGCQQVQGYLTGKPLVIGEVAELIAAPRPEIME